MQGPNPTVLMGVSPHMLGVMRYGEEHGPLAIAPVAAWRWARRHADDLRARSALGARYLETDVHTTSDGVLVCFHDATLERVTGHPGSVADHTLSSCAASRRWP